MFGRFLLVPLRLRKGTLIFYVFCTLEVASFFISYFILVFCFSKRLPSSKNFFLSVERRE